MPNAEDLLGDQTLNRAVSNIRPRSERQPDLAILEQTFVDTGVIAQLDNANNEILYGRRGTGKSHVFRVLGAAKDREAGYPTHLYVDIRVLGSAQLMTDPNQSLTLRSVSVFRDLLAEIQTTLLDWATDPDNPRASGRAIEVVSELADALADSSRISHREIELRHDEGTQSRSGVQAGVALTGPSASIGTVSSDTSSKGYTDTWTEVFRETVVFAGVTTRLDRALAELGIGNLFILVDEWTAVPSDVQPYLAEFIRRTLLGSPRVTLKIASLEYRSNFTIPLPDNNHIGFELGPDIAANIDLDDYYVYERNPDQVVDNFLLLLLRHLESELPPTYLADVHDVRSPTSFRSRLFTDPSTFIELVRAGEGVVRDFLGIFSMAYFRARRLGRAKVDINSVEEAARDWYETDKSTNLSDAQSEVLHRIITEVIGNRQARSFLLERRHANHPMIQSLFDLRLLHLMRRGYSDKENPGLRYNIYSLDYGTYVDLKRTRSQPELDMPEIDDEVPDRIVPFDDKRSIRRIILSPDVLGE